MALSNQAGQALAIVAAALAAGTAVAMVIEATPGHGRFGRSRNIEPEENPRKSRKYNVRIHGKIIDSVFHTSPETTKKERQADVKRSLVNHDGYESDIVVVETK